MTADETTTYLCTYSVGGALEIPRPCGKPAAARCDFGTEHQEGFGTYWYCLKHFRRAYDLIAVDGNTISTLGKYDGQSPAALLD
jgi:hypothetical protein